MILRRKRRPQPQLGRGVLAGALGGLVGGWMMSRSADVWQKLVAKPDGTSRAELARLEARRFVNGSSQELDSIARIADWADAHVFQHRLSSSQKGLVAAVAHYSTAMTLGAVYGALAEVTPAVTRAWGVPFGVTESLAVEAAGASLLGVTRPIRAYSPREHAQSAFDHAVYGFTLECMRRAVAKNA